MLMLRFGIYFEKKNTMPKMHASFCLSAIREYKEKVKTVLVCNLLLLLQEQQTNLLTEETQCSVFRQQRLNSFYFCLLHSSEILNV